MIRDCPLEPSSEEKAYRKERLQKQREVRFQQEPDDDEADDAEGDDQDDESVWEDLSEDGSASRADPDEDAASDQDEQTRDEDALSDAVDECVADKSATPLTYIGLKLLERENVDLTPLNAT